jgi:mRNA interferase MazF
MSYKRGDVVLALFPNSDLRTAKRRPVLVVQSDRLGPGLNQTLAAMITGNLTRSGHPSRVQVLISSHQAYSTGLKTDSVIMTDNLETIADTEIDRVLGSFLDMPAVDAALRHTLAL